MHRVTIVMDIDILDPERFAIVQEITGDADTPRPLVCDVIYEGIMALGWRHVGLEPTFVSASQSPIGLVESR